MAKFLILLIWLICQPFLSAEKFYPIDFAERNGTAMNVARSMATAGLVHGIGYLAGLSPKNVEFLDYAKKAAVNAAVNTAMSVAIDRQDFKKAMLQGMTTAALNTAASYGAAQLGGLYSKEAVNYGVHKALHGIMGAGLGAGMAAITRTDPRLGAASGAFGAVMAEMIAEGFKPEDADIRQYQKDHPDNKMNEIRSHFMERAQATANWSAFASAAGAFGLGMDVGIAEGSARNAVDNNFLPTLFVAIAGATLFEYPQYLRDLETEKAHVALGKMGIRVVEGTALAYVGGAVLGKAFEVGGRVVYSLKEALHIVRASTPAMGQEMSQVVIQLEHSAPQIEKLVIGKVNPGGIAPKRFAEDGKRFANEGRAGKQQKLRSLAEHDKLGSADRGWIQQELNAISRKSSRISSSGDLKPQKNIRVPPGKELAHRRGKAAKDGYSYEHSDLQNIDLHKMQHKYEGYK